MHCVKGHRFTSEQAHRDPHGLWCPECGNGARSGPPNIRQLLDKVEYWSAVQAVSGNGLSTDSTVTLRHLLESQGLSLGSPVSALFELRDRLPDQPVHDAHLRRLPELPELQSTALRFASSWREEIDAVKRADEIDGFVYFTQGGPRTWQGKVYQHCYAAAC